MKIVLIGRGRLATNLEDALLKVGHDVVSINSRTLESLPLEADIFVLAVKDAALPDVIRAATKGRGNQLFVHTAGSMPMDVFKGQVAHYGVFYPMQTFSKERLVSFNEIPLFIEATDDLTLAALRSLASSVSQKVTVMSSEERRYLHLAAVFACNFSNHCYALASQLLQQHGLSFDVMLPLVNETVAKVHQLDPRQAQTGPAVRFDENVIKAQMQLLSSNPIAQQVYDLMSRSIHQMAEADKETK